MGLEQGENLGFKMEMQMVEMGVEFLRKLGKTLNEKQVDGWCKDRHKDKGCWYKTVRKEIEKSLQIKLEEVKQNWSQIQLMYEWNLVTIN